MQCPWQLCGLRSLSRQRSGFWCAAAAHSASQATVQQSRMPSCPHTQSSQRLLQHPGRAAARPHVFTLGWSLVVGGYKSQKRHPKTVLAAATHSPVQAVVQHWGMPSVPQTSSVQSELQQPLSEWFQ